MRRIAVLLLVVAALLPGLSQAADDFRAAQQLYRNGQRAEAVTRLDEYLARQPRDARARFLKGVILSEEGRRAEAIAVFTSLTQDFPELPEPYNNLAVLYAAQADYDRAREALLMALRTHPGYATAHENLGDVYAALARQEYQRSVEIDKNNQTAPGKLEVLSQVLPAQADAADARGAGAAPAAPVVQAVPSGPRPSGDALPPAPAEQPAPVAAAPAEGRMDSTPESPALTAAPDPAPGQAMTPTDAPESAAPVLAQDRMGAVLQTVTDWAEAWSRTDADAYLSFYAKDFRTPKGEPRARWEAGRRADLAKLKDVKVKVISPQVTFRDAQHAVVTFRQDYASATYQVTGRKTLELVRQGERWLIQQETLVRR